MPMPVEGDVAEIAVLADGDFPSGGVAGALLRNAAKVVCCDGAADAFVGWGGTPYAIVGDCDSLSDEMRARFAGILHCDRDQETNDLTKAVNFCISRGFGNITILGATGKREDHTIGNISLLLEYVHCARVRMVTGNGVFDPVLSDTFFESRAGQQVSVFTLSPETLITTVNLKYPLHEASLGSWWPGTLNQSPGGRFGIRTTGPAIVFRVF